MDTKNLRKKYDLLSVTERAKLLSMALQRGDKEEIRSIVQASKLSHTVPDCTGLLENALHVAMSVELHRAGHIINFLTFLQMENEKADEAADFEAFLYTQVTDAWAVVSKEMQLPPVYAETSPCPPTATINMHDEVLRRFAMDEERAREYFRQHSPEGEMLTLEQRIASLRREVGL